MELSWRQIMAPRRNSRRGHRYPADQDAQWAETLDWQTNDYAVYRLLWVLLHRLDLRCREMGLRLDQLADREELTVVGMRAASWYRAAKPEYRTLRIYEYLYRELDLLVSKRARPILDTRRPSHSSDSRQFEVAT